METDAAPLFGSALETLGTEDFETASIRSAAPSYTSEAPSYHSTVPNNNEATPAYSPPERSSPPNSPTIPDHHQHSAPTLLPVGPNDAPTRGLPPIPPPVRRLSDFPSLGEFRIPTWSNLSSNPTARHYHSVAHRRVSAASSSSSSTSSSSLSSSNNPASFVKKLLVLERITEEEERARTRFRPLEDPYLVGEVAARRARAERLARDFSGSDAVLAREDRRWDWFLGSFARPSQLPSRYVQPLFRPAGSGGGGGGPARL